MSRLANQHAHQVYLLADEKSSKIIQLLRELRREDKVDHKADEAARPTDTNAVLAIIEEAVDQRNCKRK